VNDLKGYVNNEVLSDVQFIVEGIPVHAHKVGRYPTTCSSPFYYCELKFVAAFALIVQILCLRCPFFNNLLMGEYMESR
jgi:hypothetical protein